MPLSTCILVEDDSNDNARRFLVTTRYDLNAQLGELRFRRKRLKIDQKRKRGRPDDLAGINNKIAELTDKLDILDWGLELYELLHPSLSVIKDSRIDKKDLVDVLLEKLRSSYTGDLGQQIFAILGIGDSLVPERQSERDALNEKLVEATERGDLENVERYLREGADIETKAKVAKTPKGRLFERAPTRTEIR
jgi:hypothetical protein